MADGALSLLAMPAAQRLAGGPAPAARRARARRRAALLPPLPVRRRLGVDGGAGAEVLGGVLPGRRPRGPDRAPIRRARQLRLTLRSRPSSPAAPAPSGRRSTPTTTAASNRCSNSTRRSRTSTCGRGAWSRARCSATRSSCPRRPPTRTAARPPAWASTPMSFFVETRARPLPGHGAYERAVGRAPPARGPAVGAPARRARAHRAARRHGPRADHGRDPRRDPDRRDGGRDDRRAARPLGRIAGRRGARGRAGRAARPRVAGARLAGDDRRRSCARFAPGRRRRAAADARRDVRLRARGRVAMGSRRLGGPWAGDGLDANADPASSRARSRRRASA